VRANLFIIKKIFYILNSSSLLLNLIFYTPYLYTTKFKKNPSFLIKYQKKSPSAKAKGLEIVLAPPIGNT